MHGSKNYSLTKAAALSVKGDSTGWGGGNMSGFTTIVCACRATRPAKSAVMSIATNSKVRMQMRSSTAQWEGTNASALLHCSVDHLQFEKMMQSRHARIRAPCTLKEKLFTPMR